MITTIDDYLSRGCGRCPRFATPGCATRLWADELAALRRIVLDSGVTEVMKWGHPCYVHGGRNVAIIGALRSEVRLSFFEAGLLSHPMLTQQGPNSRHPDAIRLQSLADLARAEPAIRDLLQAAMDHARAGRRAPRDDSAPDLPDELVAALEIDPDLAQAFDRLTPGRRTSHILHLTSTANSSTREARIARNRPKIMAGKGAHER